MTARSELSTRAEAWLFAVLAVPSLITCAVWAVEKWG
jgi:hypothetical protein